MHTAVLAILQANSAMNEELIKSQTPAQQQVLWDRYIQISQPLHNLLAKLEGVFVPTPAQVQVPTQPPVPTTAAPVKTV